MTEAPVIHITESSPEEVAYKLLERVAYAEERTMTDTRSAELTIPDRKWILDTYAECLEAVRNPKGRIASSQ